MSKERIPVAWYQQPVYLGLVGLALMLAGWKLSTFLPYSSRADDQADQLAEVRKMATDDELVKRLDRLGHNVQRVPPYQLPGRLMLVAGLILFLVAGVQMYQKPVAQEAEEESRSEPHKCRERGV